MMTNIIGQYDDQYHALNYSQIKTSEIIIGWGLNITTK